MRPAVPRPAGGGALNKAHRKRERRNQRDRRRLWRDRIYKFAPGDVVCACGGHGVAKAVVYHFRRPDGIHEGPLRLWIGGG